MKRLIAVLVVVALVMTGAFAQLSFNVQVASELWGTNGFKFAPNMQASAGTGDDWATQDSATLFGLNYSTSKAGVTVDIRPVYKANGSNANWGNVGNALQIHQYSGWFKPFDFMKVSMGTNVQVSVFGADEMRWNCLGARAGEVCGAAVEVTPVAGLYVGYVLNDCGKDIKSAKMGAAASYAFDFANIGAQWTTGSNGIEGKEMAIGLGAAFSVGDVRVKPVYTIALDNNKVKKPMHKADLFMVWGNGTISVKFLERSIIVDKNFGNIVKAEVNYAFADNASVNLKACYGMNVKDTGNDDWSGMDYWDKTTEKGNRLSAYLSVPVAFDEGVTVVPGFLLKYDATAADNKATWSIPLTVKYAF